MPKLKSHILFYIQHHYESSTPEELAAELEIDIRQVKSAIRKIEKNKVAVQPLQTVAQSAAQSSVQSSGKPSKTAELPAPIPGQRPSTIVMNESLSAQYDNFRPEPTASPRLKKCVAIVDPDAPVY